MEKSGKNIITIIGGGLGGCFLAILLADEGYRVNLYDHLAKKDICETLTKRSYNIIIYDYTIALLKRAGVWKTIFPCLLPLKGAVTHVPFSSKPIITSVESKKNPYFAIKRAELAKLLLEHIDKNPLITIHYDTALLSINRRARTIIVQNVKTKKISVVSSEVVIGADGANSLVRSFLQQGQQHIHIQEFDTWRYRQFILSAEMIEKLSLEKRFEHVWIQKNTFIISHPDKDNTLWVLLVFQPDKSGNNPMESAACIKKHFEKNFPQLVPALSEITETLLNNPDGNFSTIHTDPWYYKNFITIIGDAAHGFYPFFGQGTSAAFGDGMMLIDLIDQYGPDWGKIFPIYQKVRKKNMDALGELSKDALLKYLRYKKADYNAIYDRIEFALYKLFPKKLYPPLALSVYTDPEHTADHKEKYLRQKKFARLLAFSFLITFLTNTISFYEKLSNTIFNFKSK